MPAPDHPASAASLFRPCRHRIEQKDQWSAPGPPRAPKPGLGRDRTLNGRSNSTLRRQATRVSRNIPSRESSCHFPPQTSQQSPPAPDISIHIIWYSGSVETSAAHAVSKNVPAIITFYSGVPKLDATVNRRRPRRDPYAWLEASVMRPEVTGLSRRRKTRRRRPVKLSH